MEVELWFIGIGIEGIEWWCYVELVGLFVDVGFVVGERK